MNLPRWSLRYPVTATMVLVSVTAIGGIAAVLPAALSAQHVKHARLAARVDSIARQALAESRTPGLSIAVARGKETRTFLLIKISFTRSRASLSKIPEHLFLHLLATLVFGQMV